MKILYFATEYPRATDTFVQREIAALRAEGLDVESMAARRPGDEQMVGEEQRSERDRTDYILPPSVGRVLGAHAKLIARSPRRYLRALRLAIDTARPGVRGGLYQAFYLAEAGVIADRLRTDEFDHLHSHFGDVSTSIAMLASELAGVPFSFTLHGPGVFFEAHTWRLDAKIERAAFVACISWFCRSQAQLLSSEDAADKLHIIHCGVDPSRYDPALRSGGDDSGVDTPVRLVFVARLDHVKGLTVLLEAIARAGEAGVELRLDIAGDGPKRAAFEKSARSLGLSDQVTFHGYVSQTDVATLLSNADVYVLPSFAEGVPVGLMEAQASAIPVVATRVGGVSELVIDGETGHLVAPGDVDGLTQRIIELAKDPALRRRMGEAGRRQVEAEFDSSIEARRLATLFRDGAGRAAVRPAIQRTDDGATQ